MQDYNNILSKFVDLQQTLGQTKLPPEILETAVKDEVQLNEKLDMMVKDGILSIDSEGDYLITMKGHDWLGFDIPIVLSCGVSIVSDGGCNVIIQDPYNQVTCNARELIDALEDIILEQEANYGEDD